MSEQPLTPSEKFFGALRSGLIRLGVPPLRAQATIRELALWCSVAIAISRDTAAVVRSTPASFRLAGSENLSHYSTACDRLIFHIAFVCGSFMTIRDAVADIWHQARAHRAAWTPTSGVKGPGA
jgi:hypothetical protein